MRTFLCAAVVLLTVHLDAATLRVSFARNGDKGPLTLRLMTRDSTRLLGTRTIPANESSTTFEGIEPGKHALLVEGDEPLKRLRTVAVAESGLKTPEDLARRRSVRYDAFLIGERFMTDPSPGDGLGALVRAAEAIGAGR